MLGRILVVDDESNLTEALCENLNSQGYTTSRCTSGTEALQFLKEHECDLLMTDLMMPNMDGIELLKNALEINPHLVGIIMTGQGTIKTAVEAMKIGAFDYVLKPFNLNMLRHTVSRAMSVRHLRKENIVLRDTLAIYELARAVTLTLDQDMVLNKVADSALAQCQADEASVMLPTDKGDELYVAAVRGGGREHIIGKRVKVGDGIAGWVAKHHELLNLVGKVNDSRFTPAYPRDDIKNAISVPMMAGGQFVGILNINATKNRLFTDAQVRGLDITVGLAASSLENAKLFEWIQGEEERYRNIVENAIEGIFQATPEGQFITVNQSLAKMLGYALPEELLKSITDIGQQLFIDSSCYTDFKSKIEQYGIIHGFEIQMYKKDGSVTWISINARKMQDHRNNIFFYEGFMENLTERKRAEQASIRARENQARIEQLERELSSLTQLSGSPGTSVTARMYGMASFREVSPGIFNALVESYQELFDLSLEQQTYKVKHDTSGRLSAIAETLGFYKAGPRDVVDIHTAALKEKIRTVSSEKKKAYTGEGWLMVLELMGDLVSFYRNRSQSTGIHPAHKVSYGKRDIRSKEADNE